MPRAFDESERARITERLKRAGRQLFAAQGVVKTSVDNLASAAGIAKGSFYKFYSNKELLFFELLEESQNRIRAPFLAGQDPGTSIGRRRFSKITRRLFDELCNDPYVRVMGQQRELQAVTRQVPASRLQQHQSEDRAFIRALIDRWSTRSRPPSSNQVAACLTMLVLVSLQREFIGARLLPYARDAAIGNLCACFFGDECTDANA